MSKIRGAANGNGDEPRAQEVGARVWERCGSVARAPKTIVQEGKKGIRSSMIVFMRIQPVTDFSKRYDAEKAGEFPGIIAGINWQERWGVMAESRSIRRRKSKQN